LLAAASEQTSSPAKSFVAEVPANPAPGEVEEIVKNDLSRGLPVPPPKKTLACDTCIVSDTEAARNPLRAAALHHCQAHVDQARRCLDMAGTVGKHAGLPAGYWSPDDLVFSREEEEFLVWAQLLDSISKESAVEAKQWINHALDVGVDKRVLELEIAYAEALGYESQAIYKPTQPIVEALEREDWDAAQAMFLQTCKAQGADKATLTQLRDKFDSMHTQMVRTGM